MTMKRIIIIAAALVLAACASPRDAKIKDGEISGITSAEATTLAKGDQRQKKVADVQKNQKPIVKLVARGDKPITIDAASFEVYVPIDPAVLLAEQPSEVSENVQMVREVRGIARETVVPLGIAGMALSDRNAARASAERTAAIDAETQRQAIAAQQAQTSALTGLVQSSQQQAIDAAREAGAASAAAPVAP